MNTSRLHTQHVTQGAPVKWGGLLGIAVVLGLALQACATTSGELSQQLYKAERAVTESMLLATDMRKKELISDEDWPEVKDGLKRASKEIDEAWAAYDKDPDAAAKSISTAEGLLTQANRHLRGLLVTPNQN